MERFFVVFSHDAHSRLGVNEENPSDNWVLCGIPRENVGYLFLLKKKTCTVFLSSFDINILAFCRECRSLIAYATHYLFCDRQ